MYEQDVDEGDWSEMNARGRSCVTRRTGDRAQAARTPIQLIASGMQSYLPSFFSFTYLLNYLPRVSENVNDQHDTVGGTYIFIYTGMVQREKKVVIV